MFCWGKCNYCLWYHRWYVRLVGAGSVVTKDVKSFEMVYGVPAKHQGWVSKAGHILQFNEEGLAIDDFDGTSYRLENNTVTQIQ